MFDAANFLNQFSEFRPFQKLLMQSNGKEINLVLKQRWTKNVDYVMRSLLIIVDEI